MGLKICIGDKTHGYYKHTKFRQNPRGNPKFLIDLTWDDPIRIAGAVPCGFNHLVNTAPLSHHR